MKSINHFPGKNNLNKPLSRPPEINNLWSFFVPVIFMLLLLNGCVPKDTSGIKIEVRNNASTAITDAVIRINEPVILEKINALQGKYIVIRNDTTYPVQSILENGNLTELLFSCDIGPGEDKEFTISKSDQETIFKQRTQAELSIKTGGEWKDSIYNGGKFENILFLRVPDEHSDHSSYIRYEGPGWESDKIGYRFYLDWRNAIDIFGKKTDTLVLQNVGQDGFGSYHEIAPWGVDILKVGESLGMGSIGYWFNNKSERVAVTDSIYCEINYSGILESKITTTYFGWKAGDYKSNLISRLSIQAGSRMTRHDLELSAGLDNLCTGIVKLPEAEYIFPESSYGEWTWIATYGKQTLEGDLLGMAILYKTKDLIRLAEDEDDYVVVLKPLENKLTYYFLAAWEQEPGGIKSKEEFIGYLIKQARILDNSLIVKQVR
jgi:hypothetical protein